MAETKHEVVGFIHQGQVVVLLTSEVILKCGFLQYSSFHNYFGLSDGRISVAISIHGVLESVGGRGNVISSLYPTYPPTPRRVSPRDCGNQSGATADAISDFPIAPRILRRTVSQNCRTADHWKAPPRKYPIHSVH